MKLFGTNYNEIGSLNLNLVLNTLGKIKIRYGKKFIDLIDENGNIKITIPKILSEKSSTSDIKSDGFYLVNNNLYAYYNGNLYLLSEGSNGDYITFSSELNLNLNLIDTVLKNIGLKFESLNKAKEKINNGIAVVGDNLYIIKNGKELRVNYNWLLDSLNKTNEFNNIPTINNTTIVYYNGLWKFTKLMSLKDIESLILTNRDNIIKYINDSIGNINDSIENIVEDINQIKPDFTIPEYYSESYTFIKGTIDSNGTIIEYETIPDLPNINSGDVYNLYVNAKNVSNSENKVVLLTFNENNGQLQLDNSFGLNGNIASINHVSYEIPLNLKNYKIYNSNNVKIYFNYPKSGQNNNNSNYDFVLFSNDNKLDRGSVTVTDVAFLFSNSSITMTDTSMFLSGPSITINGASIILDSNNKSILSTNKIDVQNGGFYIGGTSLSSGQAGMYELGTYCPQYKLSLHTALDNGDIEPYYNDFSRIIPDIGWVKNYVTSKINSLNNNS